MPECQIAQILSHIPTEYHTLPLLERTELDQPWSEVFASEPIPITDKSCLGVWGNSLNEEEFIWFTFIVKAPLFFVHELMTQEMVDRHEAWVYRLATKTLLETRFAPSAPYDRSTINHSIDYLSDVSQVRMCPLELVDFNCCTLFLLSRAQGYNELREPQDYEGVGDQLEYRATLYYYYKFEEDRPWEWHEEVDGVQSQVADPDKVEYIVTLDMKKSTTPLVNWRHVYQTRDTSIL